MKHSIIKNQSAFITGLSSIFFCSIVNAQIVFTDIPDVTLECNNNPWCFYIYFLDLNNDDTPDFSFHGSSVSCSPMGGGYTSVSIEPLNGNEVMVNRKGWPVQLDSGSKMSSSMQSGEDNSSLGPLRSIHWYCGGNAFTSENDIVDIAYTAGNWKGQGYLGLRLISNNQTYFGWAHLSVSVTSKQASLTLYDYAYQNKAGTAIHAGDTGTPLAISSNNAFKEDASLLNLKIFPNPPTSTATVTFSLSTPGKVSVRLYDITGTPVINVTEQEFTKGVQQIKLDTKDLKAGIYLLQLKTSMFVQTEKLMVTK